MVKNEYEEFYNQKVGIITRKDGYHRLEGIISKESDTQLFLNGLSYKDTFEDCKNSTGLISKGEIILVYLIPSKKD